MSSSDFIYWLNGYLELSNTKTLDEEQLKIVQDHISLVLQKVTPSKKVEIDPKLGTIECHRISDIIPQSLSELSVRQGTGNIRLC